VLTKKNLVSVYCILIQRGDYVFCCLIPGKGAVAIQELFQIKICFYSFCNFEKLDCAKHTVINCYIMIS